MNLDGTDQRRLTDGSIPRHVRDHAFSPDGQKIAFILDNQIQLMRADGSNITQLTHGPERKYNLVWSPDSHKIAFLSISEPAKGPNPENDTNNDVCTVSTDGSAQLTLTRSNAFHLFPTFNADGSKIAFLSSSSPWWTSAMVRPEKVDKVVLSVINTDGSGQVQLYDQAAVDQPCFSPDGKQIVFSVAPSPLASSHIGLISIDDMAFTALTNTSGSVPDAYPINGSKLLTICQDKSPFFSLDGRQIVFVSTRDGKSQIYAMNRDGSRLSRLSDGRGPDMSPIFTPDGSRIVFVSLRDYREDGRYQYPLKNLHEEIYIMNANGTGQKRLTKTWHYFSHTAGLDLSKAGKQRAPSYEHEVH
jgi:TolB protein